MDIGDKTIGVAVSDPLFISAQGITTIERVGIKKDTTKARSMGFKLTFVFQDERFTTKIAENAMIDAGLRREKRKEIIDRQAAVIILQSYLDTHRPR